MDEAKLKRFGTIVKARRLALGMKQDDVSAAGGPSDNRQTSIENGVPPVPSLTTLAKVDKGLRWTPGSAAATLAGGDPTPLEAQVAPSTAQADEGELERHVRLGMAFERAGVTSIAQRGAAKHTEHGTAFSAEVLDQLIEILNKLPAARERD